MFIHELNNTECQKVLGRNKVGHLACAHDNQPYVMPLNYAYDGNYLYAFTTRGQKVEWMRSNPLICFEVDEVSGHTDWTSIIVFGHYEELPDKPEYEPSRIRAPCFSSKTSCLVGAGLHLARASRSATFFDAYLLSDSGRHHDWSSGELGRFRVTPPPATNQLEMNQHYSL